MIKISAIAQHTAALATAGALLMSVSMPAQAADVANNKDGTKEAAARGTPDQIAAAKKYCVKSDFTGSKVAKKVCKTKDEWAAEGVDISKS